MRTLSVLVTVLAVSLVGCGETVIDSTKTEEQLESGLKKEQGLDVTSADCPSDVQVTPGDSFTCTVTIKGGETRTATLKIRNKDADLTLVELSSSDKSQSKAPAEGLGSNK
jgi:hypothetical protein